MFINISFLCQAGITPQAKQAGRQGSKMKKGKYLERVLNATTALLANYAAIGFGIGVFSHQPIGYISGGMAFICIFWVAALHKD